MDFFMDDLSSVEVQVEVGALLSTTFEKDDSADVFFGQFPSAEEIHGLTNLEIFQKINQRALVGFTTLRILRGINLQPSKDPDFDHICDLMYGDIPQGSTDHDLMSFGDIVGHLALIKSRNGWVPSQKSKKDQLLAYYLWRIHGSKDEASPFTVTVSAPHQSTGTSHILSHDFLPSSGSTRGPCSNCGHAGATKWCSGCCVKASGTVVFAAYYCNRDCMRAHWRLHKSACREVRATRRAAAIFTELWLKYSQVFDFCDIESITEEDGLIEMKVNPTHRPKSPIQRLCQQFPWHLAESEEQALACISAMTCEGVEIWGRHLFELIMRPVGAFVEAVRMIPKNAHKTVHISYAEDKHKFPGGYHHKVFRLTLPSGLRFAFDPTGAQNGWQEHLAPWDTYEKHRACFIEDISPMCELRREYLMAEIDGIRMPTNRFLGAMSCRVEFNLVALFLNKALRAAFKGEGTNELLYKIHDSRFDAFMTLMTLSKAAFEAVRENEEDLYNAGLT